MGELPPLEPAAPAPPSQAAAGTEPDLQALETIEAIEAIAADLTPERLVILPFYHELRTSIVKPERVKLQTEYFWQRWVPLLGPVRSLIVMRMRQYGYYNRQTKELRDECAKTYDEIAASVGISTRSLERYFESEPDPAGGPYRVLKDPLLARFIRLRHQYVWRPGKSAPERTTNEYKIAMDEPLTPEDEAALRLAAALRLKERRAEPEASPSAPASRPRQSFPSAGPAHTRHSGGNKRGSSSKRQPDGYAEAPPERQSVATGSADDLAAQPVVPPSTLLRGTTAGPAAARSARGAGRRSRSPEGVSPSDRPEPRAAIPTPSLPADTASSADTARPATLETAIATFEAANERSVTRLERDLLAALAADFDAAASARGDSGAAWVRAAIVEAVDSGSRFVAPKRIREICRRWAREGVEDRRRTPDEREPPRDRAIRGQRDARRISGEERPPAPAVPVKPAAVEAAPGDVEPAAVGDVPLEPPTFVVAPALNLTNKQLWAATLDELRSICPPGTFATWLKHSRLIGEDQGALVVGVPNSFARDWLADRFAGAVARAVAGIIGEPRVVRFEVEQTWLARRNPR